MSEPQAVLYIALGTLCAVVYPSLQSSVRRQFPPTAAPGIPPWLRKALTKYGVLFLFCLITGVLVLGAYRRANPTAEIGFWSAFFMGFGWEAAVEKIAFPTSTRAAPNQRTR